MVESIRYSDKEITIFNGVIDLIKNGDNLYTIKVSDIAKAADIGKGTIYDYFTSKEEAISKSLMYYIENELQICIERIKNKDSFRDKYYEMLFIIKDGYRSNVYIISSMLSSADSKEIYMHLADETCSGKYIFESINDIIVHLLKCGEKDGLIKLEEDMYYFMMAIRGSISSFSHYINKKEYYDDIDIQKAMETSYKILLKSLR